MSARGTNDNHGQQLSAPPRRSRPAGVRLLAVTAVLAAAGLGLAACSPLAVAPLASSGTTSARLSAVTPTSSAPGLASTGVPAGVKLAKHVGDIVVTEPGTVIDKLDVYGFVKVRAANVIIRNSRVRGGVATSNTGLIDAMSPSALNTTIVNNTLAPGAPSIWLDGVFGHDMTVRGNNMYNVVDGIGAFKTGLSATGSVNADIQGNYIHDLFYAINDPNHSDNHTHNDGIQIQGGGKITIVGNRLDCLAGTASNTRSPYYPAATGQAIALTPNVSAIHHLLIDRNWLDGGAQSIGGTLVKGLSNTINITNNRFGHQQHPITRGGVSNRWAIVLPVATMTITGNVYDDTSAPVTIFRGTP